MRATYAEDPVALVLGSFNHRYFDGWVDGHGGALVGERVAVVRGRTDVRVPPSEPRTFRVSVIGLSATASLAILGLIGLGWTLLLFARWLRPVEVIALSPAVGIAALVSGGVLIDRLGVRLVGVPGALSVLAIAAAGWALAAWRYRRARERGEPFVAEEGPALPAGTG